MFYRKDKLKSLYLGIVAIIVLVGCVADEYKPVPNMATLNIEFMDSDWDGEKIPNGQQCKRFGGLGATPPLVVDNIPGSTNMLIMEYSDSDFDRMDNGGHGKIGYVIEKGANQITIPTIPGHSFSLPEDFLLVSAHQAPKWDTAGAYLPPCSGGKGNLYYVTVKAVLTAPKGKQSQLLGKGQLDLGRY